MDYVITPSPGSPEMRVTNAIEPMIPYQRDWDPKTKARIMCWRLGNGKWADDSIGTVFNPALGHFQAYKKSLEQRIANSKAMGVASDPMIMRDWEQNEKYLDAFLADRLKARPYPATLAEAEALPRDHRGNFKYLVEGE